MAGRYTPLCALLLPLAAIGQPQLPVFVPADTITMPCPQDPLVQILTYQGWEAYQTLDDHWDGPRDPAVCIDLAFVSGNFVQPRIAMDQIDPGRPVFLRARYDDDTVLPLGMDNQYTFLFSAHATAAWEVGECAEGPCTGIRAAVRIPTADGLGTDLRWYGAPLDDSPWAEHNFKVCVTTEKFAVNDLREFILAFKLVDPQPGQTIQFFWSDVLDQDLQGNLVRLTPTIAPQFHTGGGVYHMYQGGWMNFMVMHADDNYPDADHIYHLDLGPIPNTSEPTDVTVTLWEGTAFNFQPFTQLRGGLLEGSDSLRHPLTVVNQGADLCLGWDFVELVWGDGDRYVHQEGHLEFAGRMSCFLFLPGSTLEVAQGSTLHYGRNGRGMLALLHGAQLRIGTGGTLVMHGMLVIHEPAEETEAKDLHITLGPGQSLVFAHGAAIHNANSIGGNMKLVVWLDGGYIDLAGLSPEDRAKVLVAELPRETWTDLLLLGNPARDELVLSFAVRVEGPVSLRIIDALGRRVMDRVVTVVPGDNRISLPIHGARQGTYILEAVHGGERRVLRFVKE